MDNIIELLKNNKIVQLVIIIAIVFVLYKYYNKTKEGFYSLDFMNSSDYLQCCHKYGCGSWICQQLLLYKKPLIKYVGTIYSSVMPQMIYSLYQKYNHTTASYDYLYKTINADQNFSFVKLDTKQSLKHGDVVHVSHDDQAHKTVTPKCGPPVTEGFGNNPTTKDGDFIVNLHNHKRPIYGAHRLIKGDFDTNIKPYSQFYGYNVGHQIDYDHYYPPLYGVYKRPVHYQISGDFMSTTGKYGILRPIQRVVDKRQLGDLSEHATDKLDKDFDEYNSNDFIEIYEKEVQPYRNEYQYFIKAGDTTIELPNNRKISDGDIIKLPMTGQIYKFERTEFY
jgi:hypothetical protein